ncbi:hypothetical protein FPOAC2_10321 [Fusarium poae]|uniref:Zona occludens toxin N-terminal domain-containing protein n=1 Tax=Fusarium poae TaxID=36050 RepID=A0A1B8A413_FUSPO|nr:uncharacterized protein FPOAC1_013629 [Fusarium poae]KAG8664849.1 hypothetical protein FPOAC1_013629 [Fusarium poae]OBS15211.1 hypothetical protein FPOA_13897 [Fusarium poae]
MGPSPKPVVSQPPHPHLALLDHEVEMTSTMKSVPLFTHNIEARLPKVERPAQYGLLASNISRLGGSSSRSASSVEQLKSRLFYNVAAPASTFICGSQGSGKSHTLSTILENCLISSKANQLPHPLAGLVFHYDTFVSDTGGMPCEAAYIASNTDVKVRVLCAPSNFLHIKRIYQHLPKVVVKELRISQSDLNTRRMLDLMAVSSIQGSGIPLYLHVVSRILRDMRIAQQQTNSAFDYKAFKTAISKESLTEGQLLPLQQRLETLESFMVTEQTFVGGSASRSKVKPKEKANTSAQGVEWDLLAGELTIVDLSCPCVTAETACSLFNICLSLFLEREPTIGRIVALDEAHKYMKDSSDSQTLTESLLSVIRLQRHLGTRVILSTQEPTISPKLLDLCSTVIVHRFTSPTWFATLRRHLAGVYLVSDAEMKASGRDMVNGTNTKKENDGLGSFSHLNIKDEDLFPHIVGLEPGEALLFCPNALIDIGAAGASNSKPSLIHLGSSTMKVRIRKRITADGGQSIMAN